MGSYKFMDDAIYGALKKRKKVELFICRDEEGGYGIKIDGKVAFRNIPCEAFELELESERDIKVYDKYAKPTQKTGGKGG